MGQVDRPSSAPRSFNHEALVKYPEYHAARLAIAALANTLDEDNVPGGRAAFVNAVADMARTSFAADWCKCCWGLARNGININCYPFAATVDDATGWLHGTYRCPRSGAEWTCGHASPEPP